MNTTLLAHFQVSWVFAKGPEDLGSIPGRVIPKTLKMVLNTALLNTHNIRYISRVKWNNPGKGVEPSPTLLCCSYGKGSLLVTLDYSCQLYFTYFMKINMLSDGEELHSVEQRYFWQYLLSVKAVVVSVIVYGCTTCILTKRLEKKLDEFCV